MPLLARLTYRVLVLLSVLELSVRRTRLGASSMSFLGARRSVALPRVALLVVGVRGLRVVSLGALLSSTVGEPLLLSVVLLVGRVGVLGVLVALLGLDGVALVALAPLARIGVGLVRRVASLVVRLGVVAIASLVLGVGLVVVGSSVRGILVAIRGMIVFMAKALGRVDSRAVVFVLFIVRISVTASVVMVVVVPWWVALDWLNCPPTRCSRS